MVNVAAAISIPARSRPARARSAAPAPRLRAKMRGDLAGWLSVVEALTAHHATLGVHRQLDVCGRRGADVRPDFNWNKPATSSMRYR